MSNLGVCKLHQELENVQNRAARFVTKWINAFLCYRQQRVVVNGVKSDWAPVVSIWCPTGNCPRPLVILPTHK